MLKLSEIRQAYEELSTSASNVCRQLCFAGIGIIWIYNKEESSVSLPDELQCPLFLLVLSLSIDILQYVIQTIFWYVIYCFNRKPNQLEDDIEISENEFLNILPWLFWLSKIVVMIIAYYLLANYILEKI